MIQMICDFLGVPMVSPEMAFIFGCLFLMFLISEFMSFLWSMYKAVFRHG